MSTPEPAQPRWILRLRSYSNALAALRRSCDVILADQPNNPMYLEIFHAGLIHMFEVTWELSWKLMKDYLEGNGATEINSPSKVFRLALQTDLIDNKLWVQTLADRNEAAHRYAAEIREGLPDRIIDDYFPLFVALEKRMKDEEDVFYHQSLGL